MDRREFLHSSSIAAIAGAAAGAAAPAAAQTPSAQPGATRDWSQRAPKGEPIVKRFDEQRWVLDNIIQANGIDWDQSHTAVAIRSGGSRGARHGGPAPARAAAGRHRSGL